MLEVRIKGGQITVGVPQEGISKDSTCPTERVITWPFVRCAWRAKVLGVLVQWKK